MRSSAYCCTCKSLRRNAKVVVKQSPTSKDVKTEAEYSAAFEAVTRQPVKIAN
jgi:hypothetical protein